MRWIRAAVFVNVLFAQAPPLRLPDSVIPQRYAVDLAVNPAQGAFHGSVHITLDVRERTPMLWLNAKDLIIRGTDIESEAGPVPLKKIAQTDEFVGIEPLSPIQPGLTTLSITYDGHLRQKPALGLYRVRFEGNWYAFTTFTPIEARRAFPCFDEPRFKTPWQITLHVPSNLRGFSNAPQESNTISGQIRTVRFAPTEPLPSELVALAVGPIDELEGGTVGESHASLRILAPKEHASGGQFAAEVTRGLIPLYEDYTNIPYAFHKLDEIALPEEAFSAVENPGLITFRSTSILIAPSATQVQRAQVRQTIAHELAHQWFGDFVTQADWKDVWLSEGFATWFSRRILSEKQSPDRANLAAIAARESIFKADEVPGAPPVRLGLPNRQAPLSVYNPIVYEKGAAILLMLEGWLGPDNFRNGLRAYLNAHRFGSASTSDLAEALRAASGVDVTEILHNFLDVSGVPQVRTTIRCNSPGPASLDIRASRFTPVCWRSDLQPARCEQVGPDEHTIVLDACPAWVFANAGGTGYYRTVWTAQQLAAIATHLRELSQAERLTLDGDIRAELRQGSLSTNEAVVILKNLSP